MHPLQYAYRMLYLERSFMISRGKMASKLRERYRSELRAATLSAARDLIKEEGYEGLTLRKLARRMQCSPMALYTYFADKQALLTALALEGFEKLAKRHEGTSRREPLSALRKIMLDHIAFAEENPAGDTGKQSGFPFAIQVRTVVPRSRSAPGRRLRHQHHSADCRSRRRILSNHVARLPVWLSSAIRRGGSRDNIERPTQPSNPGDMSFSSRVSAMTLLGPSRV